LQVGALPCFTTTDEVVVVATTDEELLLVSLVEIFEDSLI
jgi:hypothetical protein